MSMHGKKESGKSYQICVRLESERKARYRAAWRAKQELDGTDLSFADWIRFALDKHCDKLGKRRKRAS